MNDMAVTVAQPAGPKQWAGAMRERVIQTPERTSDVQVSIPLPHPPRFRHLERAIL